MGRKSFLAKIGGPTPGSGLIGRRHRYEHEGIADVVASLQTQVATLQQNLQQPGGSGGPGATLLGTSGAGDGQGPQNPTTTQGDNQGPVSGPIGPPGPPGPAGVGINAPIIVLWDMSKGDIPPGWSLCDGSNGTPNIVGGGNNPVLVLSSASGAASGVDFAFPVAGTTDLNAPLLTGCVQTGTGTSVLTGPTTHDHTYSADVTFTADSLSANLNRYKLVPIMWTG